MKEVIRLNIWSRYGRLLWCHCKVPRKATGSNALQVAFAGMNEAACMLLSLFINSSIQRRDICARLDKEA